MTDRVATPPPQVAPPTKSLPARLLGVVLSPQETFRSIVAHPTWFTAVLVVALVVGGAQFAFLSTRVGQDAQLDQQLRTMENFGVNVTPEMQQGMEASLPNARYWALGAVLVMSFVFVALFAGIGYGVFNAMMGGSATFKQVLAVVAHGGAISLLSQLFTIPLNYARETMSSATNLSVFLPFLEEGSVLARFTGMIDIFIIWWLVVLAIGFGVLYGRKTSAIFASFAGAYVAIAAVVAIVMRAFAGSQ
jgi:Yip1-like protein